MVLPLCELTIDGEAWAVAAVRGEARLGDLFSFEVLAAVAKGDVRSTDLLGKPFVLTLRDPFEQVIVWGGIVASARKAFDLSVGSQVHFELAPRARALLEGADCRVFQEQSAIDVLRDVLDRAGLGETTRLDLTGDYAVRSYLVQHRESDWALVSRLCSEEGLVVAFEPTEGDTILVVSDDTTLADDLPGGATLAFQDASGLGATKDAVVRLSISARVVESAVALRDYEPSTPKVLVEGKASEGGLDLPVYDWPARARDPEAAAARAKRRLEALRASRRVVRGESAGIRLVPGYAIELVDHPLASLQGRHLLTAVTWDLDRSSDGGGSRWTIRFEAIPVATPFRPPARWGAPLAEGVQTGVVVGPAGAEVHTDDQGRVRAQLRWDRLGGLDEKASTWMRVGQFATAGSMIHPRIGWDVIVGAMEGDLDAPFVLGHLYDGEHPVPYALPANKTRTAWQTATTPGAASSNEIRFEDAKGSEQIFLNASKDQNVVVGDGSQDAVGVDHVKKVGGDESRSIGATEKLNVGADQAVSIGGSESLTVSGARNVEVHGAETIDVGGSRTVTSVMGTSLDAKGGRTLTVGGSMIGASGLEVGKNTLGTSSVTVGGAWVQAAGSGVSATTLGAAAETIGGARIQAAGSSCAISSKAILAETVGGAYVIAAGGNVGEAATGNLRITVGGAFIGNAPTVLLQAESKIVVRAGGATLTITSSSIEVKAPAIASPAAGFEQVGAAVQHN